LFIPPHRPDGAEPSILIVHIYFSEMKELFPQLKEGTKSKQDGKRLNKTLFQQRIIFNSRKKKF
jgi:hypothetical protein